mmetsp:Transcript_23984/g.51720  ORF Transcript_23984/g.51720 Transcript_23984/m.51720 type:complete len:310 (-) Transcript_23984:113-1042(-)
MAHRVEIDMRAVCPRRDPIHRAPSDGAARVGGGGVSAPGPCHVFAHGEAPLEADRRADGAAPDVFFAPAEPLLEHEVRHRLDFLAALGAVDDTHARVEPVPRRERAVLLEPPDLADRLHMSERLAGRHPHVIDHHHGARGRERLESHEVVQRALVRVIAVDEDEVAHGALRLVIAHLGRRRCAAGAVGRAPLLLPFDDAVVRPAGVDRDARAEARGEQVDDRLAVVEREQIEHVRFQLRVGEEHCRDGVPAIHANLAVPRDAGHTDQVHHPPQLYLAHVSRLIAVQRIELVHHGVEEIPPLEDDRQRLL